MMFRAEQAEQLRSATRSSSANGALGLYEEALEARRMRHEQEAADLLALPRRGRYALAAAARLRHQVAVVAAANINRGCAPLEIGQPDDRFAMNGG